MPTASDLISNSMKIAGIIGDNEILSSSEQSFGLTRLNAMLESWQNERLYVFRIQTASHTLSASTGSYTIGSSGTINTDRPLKIVDPCYIRESSIDYPVKVIEAQEYARIVAKSTVTSNYPEFLYYDSAFPLGTIYLYPVPSAANVLYYSKWSIIQNFSLATTSMSLPPGYQEAIEYSLAKRLAAANGFSFSAENDTIRREAVSSIKRINSRPIVARVEVPGTGRAYNINADA